MVSFPAFTDWPFVQAINDPEEEAKRKASRNAQKTRQKKRKVCQPFFIGVGTTMILINLSTFSIQVASFADTKIRFGMGHSKKRREE